MPLAPLLLGSWVAPGPAGLWGTGRRERCGGSVSGPGSSHPGGLRPPLVRGGWAPGVLAGLGLAWAARWRGGWGCAAVPAVGVLGECRGLGKECAISLRLNPCSYPNLRGGVDFRRLRDLFYWPSRAPGPRTRETMSGR